MRRGQKRPTGAELLRQAKTLRKLAGAFLRTTRDRVPSSYERMRAGHLSRQAKLLENRALPHLAAARRAATAWSNWISADESVDGPAYRQWCHQRDKALVLGVIPIIPGDAPFRSSTWTDNGRGLCEVIGYENGQPLLTS